MAEWSKEVFSKNLRKYMELNNTTQRELAEIVGVSAPTVSEWLATKKFPRIDKIEIMANYFGILKSDLIEDKTSAQIETRKKAGVITDATLKMKSDPEFLSLIYIASKC